jgi:hypothetical protein
VCGTVGRASWTLVTDCCLCGVCVRAALPTPWRLCVVLPLPTHAPAFRDVLLSEDRAQDRMRL